MFDQLTSFLFTAGVPRQPEANPDLRAQALKLLDSLDPLQASWAGVMRRLEEEGHEAGEFALICRVHLNLLDNCAALLEIADALSDRLNLPSERLRSAAVEVKSQQDAIRQLYELATRKSPPLDPAKLLASQKKYAGKAAVEVGELLQQIHSGKVEL